MANWCSNYVTIEGKKKNIEALLDEVFSMSEEARKLDRGVRPSEIGNLQYMFYINVEDDYFTFESKWSPSNDSLKFLANKHKVKLTNEYSETNNMLFGRWQSNGVTEEDIFLDDDDWEKMETGDEDENYYIYAGEEYESEQEALEQILEDKIKNLWIKKIRSK